MLFFKYLKMFYMRDLLQIVKLVNNVCFSYLAFFSPRCRKSHPKTQFYVIVILEERKSLMRPLFERKTVVYGSLKTTAFFPSYQSSVPALVCAPLAGRYV